MPETAECPCGTCTYGNPARGRWYVESYYWPSYCPCCGAELKGDGTWGLMNAERAAWLNERLEANGD